MIWTVASESDFPFQHFWEPRQKQKYHPGLSRKPTIIFPHFCFMWLFFCVSDPLVGGGGRRTSKQQPTKSFCLINSEWHKNVKSGFFVADAKERRRQKKWQLWTKFELIWLIGRKIQRPWRKINFCCFRRDWSRRPSWLVSCARKHFVVLVY